MFDKEESEGLPGGSVVKNLPASTGASGDTSSILGPGKIPWERKWQPTPVFLLGKFLKHSCRVNALTKKGGGG